MKLGRATESTEASWLLLLLLLLLPCCSSVASLPCHHRCGGDPCEVQRGCRSWLDGGRRDRNVTCIGLDCECSADFFATKADGGTDRLLCLEGELIVCSGSSYNLSCPEATSLKVWYAHFGRSTDSVCTGQANATDAHRELPYDATTDAVALAGLSSLQRSCVTTVLTQAIGQCDGRRHCWLEPDQLLSGVEACRDTEPYLQLEYACLGDLSNNDAATEQELFFRWGLIIIGGLFPASLLALLVTVQLRRKRQDVYKMNSMHLPLTRHENPEA